MTIDQPMDLDSPPTQCQTQEKALIMGPKLTPHPNASFVAPGDFTPINLDSEGQIIKAERPRIKVAYPVVPYNPPQPSLTTTSTGFRITKSSPQLRRTKRKLEPKLETGLDILSVPEIRIEEIAPGMAKCHLVPNFQIEGLLSPSTIVTHTEKMKMRKIEAKRRRREEREREREAERKEEMVLIGEDREERVLPVREWKGVIGA